MRFFDVTGCKAEIIRPNSTLITLAWSKNPLALVNASLYDMKTREPVGTIYENGYIVKNSGNGFGCGIRANDERISFGRPWETAWDEYLTGYNSPVIDGKYVDPGFKDAYVFSNKLQRIGLGILNGRTVIVADDNVTLKQFALNAIKQGVDTLVNFDGGGSRFLYYNGKTIYSSARVPYNAIAFYGEMPKQQCPYKEPTRNLYYGCRGEDVKWLQWQLIRHGHNLSGADGIFGPNTWRETIAFQKTFTKWPDGICGPNTRRELMK